MRFRVIALSLLFVIAAVAGVLTRQASPAQLALEAAKRTETIDRNLPAAIVQYRDVATRYESDLTVAPTALLQLAVCYEQLRQPEARETYERIVKYYPDSAPAKTARVKLAEQQEVGLTTTRLTLDQTGDAPFMDGRFFTDWSPSYDLTVRDMRSGSTRQLTQDAKASAGHQYLENAVPSPDGRQIAYSWATEVSPAATSGRKRWLWQLRVINPDGRQQKLLCCDGKLGGLWSEEMIQVYGWSGDSKQILFTRYLGSADLAFELMTVPATGGVPRRLKTLIGGIGNFGAAWSPDGRFIVYDAIPTGSKTADHDLFIMHADGSNAEPLVTHAADKQMLHWFPDGKRILFLSDRAGSNGVWAQTIADGKAVGEPTLVKTSVGMLFGQGFTRDGSYYYRVFSGIPDVFTARLTDSGALSGKLEPLPSRFSGSKMSGVWSRDGTKIAYVHVPAGVTPAPSLSIQTVSTREVQTIPLQLNRIANPAWMPDGRSIIVEGSNKGAYGLFRIELSNGSVSTVGELATAPAPGRSIPAVSPNGREVFFALALGFDLKGIQAQDLASGTVRTVFDGPVLNFALSPDGQSVAIASPNRETATDHTPPFLVVPLAGGAARALGSELGPSYHGTGFEWSADGRYLYFARVIPKTRMALWRVPVDGGPAQPTDIPFTNEGIRRISTHPDGLLAISAQSVDNEYWVMRNIPLAAKR